MLTALANIIGSLLLIACLLKFVIAAARTGQ